MNVQDTWMVIGNTNVTNCFETAKNCQNDICDTYFIRSPVKCKIQPLDYLKLVPSSNLDISRYLSENSSTSDIYLFLDTTDILFVQQHLCSKHSQIEKQ